MNELPPIPSEYMDAINMAQMGTLPDPLADPDILTLWVAGGRVSFINTVDDNGGQFSLFDLFVPPNIGPPLHFHTYEDEWFYVVNGNVGFQQDDKFVPGEPETLIFSPAGERHAFQNTSSEPARLLLFYTPTPEGDPMAVGNIENFFQDPLVGQQVDLNNPETPPPFNPAELIVAGPQYGLMFPSTFVFAAPEFAGNEVSILRTGVTDEAASVTLSLSNGLEIPVNFGVGEFLQTVNISPEGNQTLDLILEDPSDNSFLGLIQNTAVLTPPVQELVFGTTIDNEFDAADSRDDFDGNRDLVFTGAGEDLVDASQGIAGGNRVYGGSGGDELIAGVEDRLFGGTSNDILDASQGSGRNRLYGGKGDDEIFLGTNDRGFGGEGNDRLDATQGSGGNRSYGGEGDDSFFLGSEEVACGRFRK